ncbi:hypothetical protein WM40_16595 [Robbsia andropogonis]|uniref:Uncharacterized protein n=1 Tax=Robbsia andropogonis TaxID=28092 RepID=A0A0F5JY07_9BURK|nr:hypothetical protein WM40_16595 [Robbsia andropogonis]
MRIGLLAARGITDQAYETGAADGSTRIHCAFDLPDALFFYTVSFISTLAGGDTLYPRGFAPVLSGQRGSTWRRR